MHACIHGVVTKHRDTTSLRWRARVAKAAASHELEDWNQHNNNNNNNNNNDNDSTNNNSTKDRMRQQQQQCFSPWHNGIACLAITSSFLSLHLYSSCILIKTASILTILLCPLFIHQSRKLHHGRGNLLVLQQMIATELQQEIHYCQIVQERLYRTLTRLDTNMEQVRPIEKQCNASHPHHHSINKRIRIAHEQIHLNQQLYPIMKQQLQQTMLRKIIELRTDSDGQQQHLICPRDLERLMIQLQDYLPTMYLDKDKFRDAMTAGNRSIRTLLEMMNNLDGSDIFHLRLQHAAMTDTNSSTVAY
jgi:hypothetical protein